MARSRGWRSYKPGAAGAVPVEAVALGGLRGNAAVRTVLGLDPGSRATGFGVIRLSGGSVQYVASGTIRASAKDFAGRLREIHAGVIAVMETHRPDEIAIERVFVNRNVDSALKLGQARGAALAATFAHPVAVHEYAPREVKLAVVGVGSADKVQVQKMVTVLLGLKGRLGADAADALAIGLCHFHRATALGALTRAVRS